MRRARGHRRHLRPVREEGILALRAPLRREPSPRLARLARQQGVVVGHGLLLVHGGRCGGRGDDGRSRGRGLVEHEVRDHREHGQRPRDRRQQPPPGPRQRQGHGQLAALGDGTQLRRGLLGGRPVDGVVGEHRGQHRRERARLPRGPQLARRDAIQDGVRVFHVPAERRGALDGGVEGRAERVHVGRGQRAPAVHGLRRQVRGGARDHPGRGDRRVAGRVRDPEVGELRALVGQQDVARLDVPVHDPGLVRRGQRVGDLRADLGHLRRRQRAALGEHLGEAVGGQVLHHQHRQPVVLHDVEDRDGVRMVQPRGDPALAQHPVAEVAGLVDGQHPFDGDPLAQSLVERPPHRTHGAGTEFLQQPVAARHEVAHRARPRRDHLFRLRGVRRSRRATSR